MSGIPRKYGSGGLAGGILRGGSRSKGLHFKGIGAVVIGDLWRSHAPRAAQGLQLTQGAVQAAGIGAARPEQIELVHAGGSPLGAQGDALDGGFGWPGLERQDDPSEQHPRIPGRGGTLYPSCVAAASLELEAQIRSIRRDGDPEGSFKLKSIAGIERALERGMGAELERLQRALPMLATTASVTPFIGLFGTVWGIMNTFHAICVTGSTSIVTVAPGIAEALVNTAAGLLAAIPAVVAYNHLLAKVRVLHRRMGDFSLEFLNLVERNFT
ncbi:MAG: MotA/TolQ/ExbB proton channel family protein [Acidobacteria bacterium]|nr:MotA/TolQ/ExbB proton channel family protein [Candidatus Sulfomarinibacter sp. MAG AM1]